MHDCTVYISMLCALCGKGSLISRCGGIAHCTVPVVIFQQDQGVFTPVYVDTTVTALTGVLTNIQVRVESLCILPYIIGSRTKCVCGLAVSG